MIREQRFIYSASALVATGLVASFMFVSSGGADREKETEVETRYTNATQESKAEQAPVKTQPRKSVSGIEAIAAQFEGTAEDPCGHLDGDTKKTCNRAAMNYHDRPILKAQGFTSSIKINGYGRNCQENGTVQGAWKGNASSVSYSGTINGEEHNICIDHRGKTSKATLATGPSLVSE